jgi:hypothetical protein
MCAELTIKTNSRARDILYWHDLTPREQAEFDYLDSEDRQDQASFFRYRGNVYDLGEFMHAPAGMFGKDKKWHGYVSDSFFSGVLVRYVDDNEAIIAAMYFS